MSDPDLRTSAPHGTAVSLRPAKATRPSLFHAWWPAAVWTLLITFESTDYFSARNTSSMLYSLLTRVFGDINLDDFLVWHHLLRKTGHVVGYGMLCLLLLRGWRATFGQSAAWHRASALLAWVGTAFVASMDEWHQSFIPSRGASVWDVLLDSAAGVLFLTLTYLWWRRVGQKSSLSEVLDPSP